MKRLTLLAATACGCLFSAQSVKIVVTGMPPEAIRDFQSVSPQLKVVSAERDQLLKEAADADAIFGTINPDVFHAAHRLKRVQLYSTGVETYLFPSFTH